MMPETGADAPAVRDLHGKVALVTGAAGGLGAAVCTELVARGAAVVGVDVAGEGALLADMSSEAGNRLAVDTVLERYGRLDILVLSAGVMHLAPISEFPTAEWDRVMDVLVKGPFLSMRTAWPALTARPGGRIIAIASTCSFVGDTHMAAYVAGKHALVGLVKVAALEGGPLELTANAVAPSLMMTGMIERQMDEQVRILGKSREEIISDWSSAHAIKRPVATVEVAATVAFLASERASGITGAVVPVDLGSLAQG